MYPLVHELCANSFFRGAICLDRAKNHAEDSRQHVFLLFLCSFVLCSLT